MQWGRLPLSFVICIVSGCAEYVDERSFENACWEALEEEEKSNAEAQFEEYQEEAQSLKEEHERCIQEQDDEQACNIAYAVDLSEAAERICGAECGDQMLYLSCR